MQHTVSQRWAVLHETLLHHRDGRRGGLGSMQLEAKRLFGEDSATTRTQPLKRIRITGGCGLQNSLGAGELDPLPRSSHSSSSSSPDIPGQSKSAGAVVHNDFCEVCQKPGKLLLCDTCPKAFHAQCIQRLIDLDSFAQCSEWSCPVCQHGEQILQGHARLKLDPAEMEVRMDLLMKANKKQHRLARLRRDLFLKTHYDLIEPFLAKAAKGRLKKQTDNPAFASLPIGGRVRVSELASGNQDYEAMVLAQSSSSRYVVAEVSTGKEAEVERSQLSEAGVMLPGGDAANFLGHAREQVLSEDTKLKDYQAAGVNWMLHACYNRCGGILADDMGLGKTVQTLAVLSWLQSSGAAKGPFLVIAPLSCAGNWIREAKRFVPHMSVAKVCGVAKEREHSLNDDEIWYGLKDIVITTYETIKSMDEFFQRHFWSVMVLDEAHRIKSQFTATRQVLDSFNSASRLLLTGTPLQNNLMELFELLRFLWPDVLAEESEVFTSAVQLPIDLFNSIGRADNVEHDPSAEAVVDMPLVRKVRSLLEMVMLRRRKEEVISLPPKVIYDIWLPLTSCQATWYKALLKCRHSSIRQGARAILQLLLRLRLVCTHPRCIVTNETVQDVLYKDYPDLDGEELKKLVEAPMSEHVIAQSGKLTFLEKLLGHLHAQNMGFSTDWRKAFEDRQRKLHKTPRRAASAWLKGADGVHFLDEMRAWRQKFQPGVADATSSSSACQASQEDCVEAKPETDAEGDTPRPHKVLIFSQYRACLDILEHFCVWHGWRYLRLDGSTSRILRELDIRDFNCSEEDYFIYLIGTRAGGLGINLASANHVVLFDQDWNPHVDHQAIDRAHRIGQHRKVFIYKLVQEWTVEERLVHRQEQKLKMEQCVIESSGLSATDDEEDPRFEAKERLSAEEVIMLLRHGEHTLKHFTGQSCGGMTLQAMLERPRRPLLTAATEIDESIALPAALQGASLEDDTIETECKGVHDMAGTATAAPAAIRDAGSAESSRSARARADNGHPELRVSSSGRIIRPPSIGYDPQALLEARLEKAKKAKRPTMRHFSQCFICGEGSQPQKGSVNGIVCEKGESRQQDIAPCDLLCEQCPNSFHSTCLHIVGTNSSAGIYQSRNRWVCGWHFCAQCGRSSSSCGGMLITCLHCPSALCYDCFPPNFRRVHPPPKFWADLHNKGYKATPRKMAFFKCNACRTHEEQQRRQEMRREDLAAQQDERKRAALEEKRSWAERQKQREGLEARRRMRQVMLEHERAGLQQRMDSARQAIEEGAERLWPALFRRRWIGFCAGQLPTRAIKRARMNILPVKLCVNCAFPGHVADDCPRPAERILQRHGDKSALLGCCGNCKKAGHRRMQCPSLTLEQLKEYEKHLKNLTSLAVRLEETEPVPEPPEERTVANIGSAHAWVNAAVTDLIHKAMKCLSLENLIVERSKVTTGKQQGKAKAKGKGKGKAKAKAKANGRSFRRGMVAVAKAKAKRKGASSGKENPRLDKPENDAFDRVLVSGPLAGWAVGGNFSWARITVRARRPTEDKWIKTGLAMEKLKESLTEEEHKTLQEELAVVLKQIRLHRRRMLSEAILECDKAPAASSSKRRPKETRDQLVVKISHGPAAGWTVRGKLNSQNCYIYTFRRPNGPRWEMPRQAYEGTVEEVREALEQERSHVSTQLRKQRDDMKLRVEDPEENGEQDVDIRPEGDASNH